MNKVFTCLGIIILLAAATFLIVRGLPEDTPENQPKTADSARAKMLLENLAYGMRAWSNINGGGGNVNFPSSVQELGKEITLPGKTMTTPGLVADFFVAAAAETPAPYGGYIVRLEEKPAGDKFKTNFRLIASPAPGYIGKTYTIDKFEKFAELEVK